MKGYLVNLEEQTIDNTNFRTVIYTARNSQLVLMSLKPGEEIGEEVHSLDQFIRVEEGRCKVFLEGIEYMLSDGWAVVIPAGTRHNVVNIGKEDLKLYTIYSPPEHKDGTVHKTKEDALQHPAHFDGQTTE